MTVLGVRTPHSTPRLVGRSPVDYAQELQDYLAELNSLSSVLNTVVTALPPEFLTVGAAPPDTSTIIENQVFGR